MTIEKIIEIPGNRRVCFDLPSPIQAGKARIAINVAECAAKIIKNLS
jgi:hypothetical protein